MPGAIPISIPYASTMELAQAGGNPLLHRVLRLMVTASKMDGACLLVLWQGDGEVLAADNLPLSINRPFPVPPYLRQVMLEGRIFEDIQTRDDVATLPTLVGPVGWRAIRFMPIIARPSEDLHIVAAIGSMGTMLPKLDGRDADVLSELGRVCADEMRLIRDVAACEASMRTQAANLEAAKDRVTEKDQQVFDHDTNDVVSNFLVKTLIRRSRVKYRDGIAYHAIRAWRKAIKEEQIIALKALKSRCNISLERVICEDLNAWSQSNFGAKVFDAIVPMPCGHSGNDCLSKRIAERFARKTDTQYVEAFEDIAVAGTSHPKTNVRRPRMKLRQTPCGDILLIDDVATSGKHMEEASKLLRAGAASVVSVCWIADG